jgi:hypothetical protein
MRVREASYTLSIALFQFSSLFENNQVGAVAIFSWVHVRKQPALDLFVTLYLLELAGVCCNGKIEM